MLKALILSLSVVSLNTWAGNFSLRTEEKDPAAAKLLHAVEALIPAKMKEVIDAPINVKFVHLNDKKVDRLNESCDQKLILGQAIMLPGISTLQLDRILLDGVTDIRSISCSHKDTFTYAKAIAVHEISHFYDNKIKASNDITFLNLSGWVSKGMVIKKRMNLNKASERSPDVYEFKNPAETFAVNFEFFMLDKTFQCRRPTYYNHYSRLLGFSPFGAEECQMNKKITLITQSLEKKPLLTKEIDPSRIYQIHYLFAGKGKEMMSRWGHAMFRLVICAPGRAVGPDCLQDFANHIVISYRANVDDMTLDYKKGMDGSYASQLFLMSMNDVVNEYTKGEFRDVISLPLALGRNQIKLFTDKLLENYWSYKGSYFFLSNNCASEAMNLLRVAYPGDKVMQKQSITTPLGMYDFFIKKKLVDVNVLDNTKNAIYYGYLFPGVSEKLMASLKVFTTKMTFETFALELKAPERKVIYDKTISGLKDKDRMNALAHALRLEDQILICREQKFAKKIAEELFGSKPSAELKGTELDERMMEMREQYKRLAGENFVEKGYGIPLKEEYHDVADAIAEEVLQKIQENSQELKDIVMQFYPEEVMEMQRTLENRFYLLTGISKAY